MTEKLQTAGSEVGAPHGSYLWLAGSTQGSKLVSFFSGDDGPPSSSSPTATRSRSDAGGAQRRPRPRRPQRSGFPSAHDRHAVMVRRRIAAGAGVVLLILVILLISALVKGGKAAALTEYNRSVNQIARESETHVAKKLFATLVGAGSREALSVEVAIERLHTEAQQLAARARSLSVPSEMAEAQRNLLLALDLRSEGVGKIAGLVRAALGGKDSQADTQIAGDMEMLLASDVLWSQRIKPLISEALTAGGATSASTAFSRSLPNLGWLDAETVASRLGGQQAGSTGKLAPGTHGDALVSVSVGTTTLQAEPAVNHLPAGTTPVFTAAVEDSGENEETGVKVEVAVTSNGGTSTATKTIAKIKPKETVNIDIPAKVPAGVAAKATVKVHAVPGETNLENNTGSYLVFFE